MTRRDRVRRACARVHEPVVVQLQVRHVPAHLDAHQEPGVARHLVLARPIRARRHHQLLQPAAVDLEGVRRQRVDHVVEHRDHGVRHVAPAQHDARVAQHDLLGGRAVEPRKVEAAGGHVPPQRPRPRRPVVQVALREVRHHVLQPRRVESRRRPELGPALEEVPREFAAAATELDQVHRLRLVQTPRRVEVAQEGADGARVGLGHERVARHEEGHGRAGVAPRRAAQLVVQLGLDRPQLALTQHDPGLQRAFARVLQRHHIHVQACGARGSVHRLGRCA
mmetsp:Transcript_24067/g.83543  ORF Transcript_24067/g.83543 Transcript_24067/m.83543 type:complete len:280 (-) Transcript_24067:44-883(-)